MRGQRQRDRDALRQDLSGSGPTTTERPISLFPGATARFALFGEVLSIGLLVTLAALPILTAPAALAAGARHMQRFVRAEGSPPRAFWDDVRRGAAGGALTASAALSLAALLVVNVSLGASGTIPGGKLVAGISATLLVAEGAALLTIAAAWTPERGWRAATAALASLVRADVVGSLYLVATVVFVAVATWALPPLLPAVLGCTVLAMVAIPGRPRR